MLEVTVETKKCKTCGEVKPLDQYPKQGRNSNGTQRYNSKCKRCACEYIKKHRNRPEVKEREREYHKEYYRKPEVKERRKEYYKEYIKKYRNRPEVKELRKEQAKRYFSKPNVKERMKEYSKKYYHERYKEYYKEYNSRKHSISLGLSYSINLLREYKTTKKMLKNCCAYCGVYLTPQNEHLEHIIPISVGGTNTPDNIVCSCAKCNLSKNARPMEEWYREQPFFSEERLQQIYAIRDYWNAVGFEVAYPTEDQVKQAHEIAENALETIQNMSRLQRDPDYIQEYI